MAKTLTDRLIKAAKAAAPGKRRMIPDGIVPGLYLRITDKGQKSFVLVARFGGSKNPVPRKLGSYGAMSLEQARNKARTWLGLLARGIDPGIYEAQERAAELAKQENSFAAVFESYVANHLSKLRSGRHVEQSMRRTLMKPWGTRPISAITRKDVIAVVFAVHDRGARTAANRLLVHVKGLFAWAVERGILDSSPAALIKRPAKERARDRTLSDDEIRAVWRGCESLGPAGRAIRFMLCTGQRRAECGSVPWLEMDPNGRTWSLPASRTKAARAHQIPLSDPAIQCLGEPGSGFVFSNNGGSKPITSWSKPVAKLREIVAQELPGVAPDWTLHDLRRTAASGMAMLGADRVTIGKLLNHSDDDDITARYDRHRRQTEMRAAMDAWGRHLARLIDGGEPATVVGLHGRRP
jgi:integrase